MAVPAVACIFLKKISSSLQSGGRSLDFCNTSAAKTLVFFLCDTSAAKLSKIRKSCKPVEINTFASRFLLAGLAAPGLLLAAPGPGILRSCPGVLVSWSPGIFESGILEPWSPGIVEFWSPGVLASSNPRVLESWNPVVLELWNPGGLVS